MEESTRHDIQVQLKKLLSARTSEAERKLNLETERRSIMDDVVAQRTLFVWASPLAEPSQWANSPVPFFPAFASVLRTITLYAVHTSYCTSHAVCTD